MLGAHYDTCGPLPGADDNAAAVSMALEVAERLVARPAQRDVVIALFDSEEPPHFYTDSMGSVQWYRHQRTGSVHSAVVLDLVGHDLAVPGLEDLLFVMGMETDPALADIAVADQSGLRVQPILSRYADSRSDHFIFELHERPFLFLSCAEWEHYHQPTDTPDKLSWVKMAAITEYLDRTVRGMAAVPLDAGYGAYDTTAVEAACVRKNFGSVMALAKLVRFRWQIDSFVLAAKRLFGLG